MSLGEEKCLICRESDPQTVYDGPIRVGAVKGQGQIMRVLECRSCGAQRLDPFPEDPLSGYVDGSYRQAYDGSAAIASYYAVHDHEQASKLSVVGVKSLRGKVVADIGCGAGAFLDVIRGVAGRLIAVEPMQDFHAHLSSRVSSLYPTTKELAVAEGSQVDVAVSFSVIEHVADPRTFLSEIGTALAKQGTVHLTTPNRAEILMRLCSETFAPFFYRTAHLWYFDAAALTKLAHLAGFRVRTMTTLHSYDLSNFALWLRDGRPTGVGQVAEFGPVLDAAWRTHLVQSGMGDHLYAILEPN